MKHLWRTEIKQLVNSGRASATKDTGWIDRTARRFHWQILAANCSCPCSCECACLATTRQYSICLWSYLVYNVVDALTGTAYLYAMCNFLQKISTLDKPPNSLQKAAYGTERHMKKHPSLTVSGVSHQNLLSLLEQTERWQETWPWWCGSALILCKARIVDGCLRSSKRHWSNYRKRAIECNC